MEPHRQRPSPCQETYTRPRSQRASDPPIRAHDAPENRRLLGNLLKAFRKDEAIETTQACTFLGFDIIFELAYGYNAKLQTSEEVRWLVNGILTANRRINVFLQWPFLKKTKVDKLFTLLLTPQVLRYHKQVFTMIEQRKNQEKHARPDLFSFVSGYKDPETGQGLSNDELFAESILLLPAGGDVRKPRVYCAL
jgi:cytochrome P450